MPKPQKEEWKRFFSWRQAFMESDLQPSTKLVLHTIASHMNAMGSGAFPSVQTIMRQASLSKNSVLTHIEAAVSSGWLNKHSNEGEGRAWKHSSYSVSWPNSTIEPSDDAVQPLHQPADDAVQPLNGGGSNGGVDAVQPLHPSTSGSTNTKSDYYKQPENGSIDTVQNLLPWMEKQWREFRRKEPWPPPKWPAGLVAQEEQIGKEKYRLEWIEYLKSEAPTPGRFATAMRDKFNLSSGGKKRELSGRERFLLSSNEKR